MLAIELQHGPGTLALRDIRTQAITAYRLTANDTDSGSHADVRHSLSG